MSHDNPAPLNPPSNPLLIILSGLSGAGKDAVLTGLRKSGFHLEFIVTVTTRQQRAHERDGEHYHFVSDAEFRKMIDGNQLIEWANVYGNLYGVPGKPVKNALKKGRDVIVKVDVQGAETIKKQFPQAVFIFLTTSSMEDLAQRLKQRKTEKRAELDLRLQTAGNELERLSMFDYIVVNRQGELERAVAEIEAIITAEKCRLTPREISL
jgi:guanylate kinase